ncbi:pre-rRNA-processing protein esf1 [Coemansia erecta]|uniref:Pre-rRNA-processing protein esf1 n=1 Tax=Coemansia asiatica TaxID=1052880 RepID=A0A9W7XQ92_9FUNG|nr:pre-rRNA-processing protein esf1 [Coemansia asiatica]KAJ2854354.1 pre-rRNA-processing protein esf1 [Coemansia erecta]
MVAKKDDANQMPVKKVTKDSRFAHVQEDPRFMRPKKSQSKVKVDKRFAHMIKDKDFTESVKIDRYGRRHEDNRAETYLRNTYDFSGSESKEESESEVNSSETEDSDSESKHEKKKQDESDSEDSESESDDGGSSDDDDSVSASATIDRARGRGVDSDESSSDSDHSDISDVDWGKVNGAEDGGFSDVLEDPDDIPRGEETKRFACVNMDWEHVHAVDLLTVFTGFKPDGGAVLSVKIYPSEFGKERMSKEAVEGPPHEIFAKHKKKSSSDSDPENTDSDTDSGTDSDTDLIKEQVADNEEFNQIALRKYELERLRYYYAVVECDAVETAHAIYKQCDGAEYEASANFFDLRFIPDDMVFSDTPKDEAAHVPEKYEPLDFATQAMQHSKVKLTWDADEPSRTKITRRAFTQDEIDNMDFSNLLASSSGESSDEDDLARKRALLLSGDQKGSDNSDDDSDDDKMGEMEITFTPGLSEAAAARLSEKKVAQEEAERKANETTIERFRRLKKERREKWKESKKNNKRAADANDDDSDNLISGNELDADKARDSFFTYSDDEGDEDNLLASKPSSSKSKKGAKKETKSERWQRLEQEDKQRAELELLLDGAEAERKHFDMDEILKSEKKKGRKNKSVKNEVDQDDFRLDTQDPRFSALFDSHNFAIDPNNPNFKKTKAMKSLLDESRKRRRTGFN